MIMNDISPGAHSMERRKSERTNVRYEGTLTLDNTPYPCTVCDLSGVGAMLVFDKINSDIPTYEDMEYEGYLTITSETGVLENKKAMVVRFSESDDVLNLAIQFY